MVDNSNTKAAIKRITWITDEADSCSPVQSNFHISVSLLIKYSIIYMRIYVHIKKKMPSRHIFLNHDYGSFGNHRWCLMNKQLRSFQKKKRS